MKPMSKLNDEQISQALWDETAAAPQPPAVAPEPEEIQLSDDELAEIMAEVSEAVEDIEKPVQLSTDELAKGEEVAANTFIFSWKFEGMNFTHKVDARQVARDEYQEAAKEKMLSVTKKDIVCAELKSIKDRRRQFKDEDIMHLRLPTDLLPGGMALVPIKNYDKVIAAWTQFKADDKANIVAFLKVYGEEQARAKRIHGDIYNPRHYPTVKEVANKFRVKYDLWAMDAPKALEQVSKAAFQEASSYVRAQVAEACAKMESNLNGMLVEGVDWLISQLGMDASGKRKQIDEKKYADTINFFKSAKELNVTGNEEFDAALELALAAVDGKDVKDFKATGKAKAAAGLSQRDARSARTCNELAPRDRWRGVSARCRS
jgi:hypothetical protein